MSTASAPIEGAAPPGVESAQRRLAESRARARADARMLENADALVEDLRAQRAENHWATRVREAFRAVRG